MCNADGTQRSVSFLGSSAGNDELHVTRGGPVFDARQSQWIVTIFDIYEQPLTEFYLERVAGRSMKSLAGALYLQPKEYSEAEQPEIATYVWLPPSAFDSLWNIATTTQSIGLQMMLYLTAPFQGSALNYLHSNPDGYDKIWNAEAENPLLFGSSEFRVSPISRKNSIGS